MEKRFEETSDALKNYTENLPELFRMFNDSAAARGDSSPEKVEVSNEQVALASLMKGVHF